MNFKKVGEMGEINQRLLGKLNRISKMDVALLHLVYERNENHLSSDNEDTPNVRNLHYLMRTTNRDYQKWAESYFKSNRRRILRDLSSYAPASVELMQKEGKLDGFLKADNLGAFLLSKIGQRLSKIGAISVFGPHGANIALEYLDHNKQPLPLGHNSPNPPAGAVGGFMKSYPALRSRAKKEKINQISFFYIPEENVATVGHFLKERGLLK
jgi:hypothetical protein